MAALGVYSLEDRGTRRFEQQLRITLARTPPQRHTLSLGSLLLFCGSRCWCCAECAGPRPVVMVIPGRQHQSHVTTPRTTLRAWGQIDMPSARILFADYYSEYLANICVSSSDTAVTFPRVPQPYVALAEGSVPPGGAVNDVCECERNVLGDDGNCGE